MKTSITKPSPYWFYLPTVLAAGFLMATIGTYQCKKELTKIRHSVDEDTYNKVIHERKMIYKQAIAMAILLAILYLICITMCKNNKSMFQIVSDVLCIVLGFTFLFYMLSTAKYTMLTPENTKEWLASYTCMQKHYWNFFTIGIVFSTGLLCLYS